MCELKTVRAVGNLLQVSATTELLSSEQARSSLCQSAAESGMDGLLLSRSRQVQVKDVGFGSGSLIQVEEGHVSLEESLAGLALDCERKRLSVFVDVVFDSERMQPSEDWATRLAQWLEAGLIGFRCIGLGTLQAHEWSRLIESVRTRTGRGTFLAWTPGLAAQQVSALRGVGFDATFLSLPWWNYREPWLVDEYARLRSVAPVIAPLVDFFVPRIEPGVHYKYELVGCDGQQLPLKADPVARRAELPPATASVVGADLKFEWSDAAWLQQRSACQAPDQPMSIYEVHMGSWRPALHSAAVWRECGRSLIDYARGMGFTHIELLPIMEHPFGGSWGYQPLGLFAPTARWGGPEDFAWFVNACHEAGLGVILDWVPAHFPSDSHGLAEFDGTALYEHADPRQGVHPDWNTLIYNFGRTEVRNFLIASALEWLRRYHVDGLRVDAVASMLYLDYSREPGHWTPNRYGGRENLEAVSFLRELNSTVHRLCPGAVMVAEESTAWPGVTAVANEGGLGFDYKWNMGWMHDTLRYMGREPVHRKHHHDDLTFGTVYAWSEHFVLALSHDEVVHGKGSLLGKMAGDRWQQFANLRTYYTLMWTHPGRKLIFMGGELAQPGEWNHDGFIDWACLDDPFHAGVQRLVKDLNGLYGAITALHCQDSSPDGFAWQIGDDRDNSVFAFERRGDHESALVVCNMTPVPREAYRIGVSQSGRWREALNSDADVYGGSNMGNGGEAYTSRLPAHGQPQSLSLTLPPLAALILIAEG